MKPIHRRWVRTLVLVGVGFGLGWLLAPQAAQSGLRLDCPDPNAIDVICAGNYVVVGQEGVVISNVQVHDVGNVGGVPAKAVAFRAVNTP
jgi:hypothetical protein